LTIAFILPSGVCPIDRSLDYVSHHVVSDAALVRVVSLHQYVLLSDRHDGPAVEDHRVPVVRFVRLDQEGVSFANFSLDG
jgi:hypothetical protein